MAQHGMVQHGMGQHGMELIYNIRSLVWYSMAQHGMIQHGMAQHGIVTSWHSMVWLHHGAAWYGTALVK